MRILGFHEGAANVQHYGTRLIPIVAINGRKLSTRKRNEIFSNLRLLDEGNVPGVRVLACSSDAPLHYRWVGDRGDDLLSSVSARLLVLLVPSDRTQSTDIAGVSQIHHSDERMNPSTWARDHFLQESWRTFFSVFTLSIMIDLHPTEAGKSALYSTMFLIGLSMFYHLVDCVPLLWLDRILMTPQVHRIHHSASVEHPKRNFADVLPIFDIVFGTYHRPTGEEFPATRFDPESPAPHSFLSAQFGPNCCVRSSVATNQARGFDLLKRERAEFFW